MVDRIGRRYGVRPSEIIGISDQMVAFQFDYVIAHFADLIESGKVRDPRLKKKKMDDGFEKLLLIKNQADRLRGIS